MTIKITKTPDMPLTKKVIALLDKTKIHSTLAFTKDLFVVDHKHNFYRLTCEEINDPFPNICA